MANPVEEWPIYRIPHLGFPPDSTTQYEVYVPCSVSGHVRVIVIDTHTVSTVAKNSNNMHSGMLSYIPLIL